MNFSLTIVKKSHFSSAEEYNCSGKREKSMNQINVVTIGKLIEAHREGDEQKRSAEYADYKPGMLYVSVYEVFPAEADK